jgi:hypothetical protein
MKKEEKVYCTVDQATAEAEWDNSEMRFCRVTN